MKIVELGNIGPELLYDRMVLGVLGVIRDSVDYNPKIDVTFKKKLRDAFDHLWKLHPLGAPSHVFTGGVYADKPGYHGKYRAFDLDAIYWKFQDHRWVANQYETPAQKQEYLGIQGVLMMHFGTVLGWEYNDAHKDHIHFDDGRQPGFRMTRSIITYLQAALYYVFDNPVEIDGIWGPETLIKLRKELTIPRAINNIKEYLEDESHWRMVLTSIVTKAFELAFPVTSEKRETLPGITPPKLDENAVRKWAHENRYQLVHFDNIARIKYDLTRLEGAISSIREELEG